MELKDVCGEKIVALFGAERAMSYPAVAQVDAYWDALRGDRAMPCRSEVDPRGLEAALEYAFVLEHIAPGVGRLRVAGMHLNDLLGMEVRGMPLSAFIRPDARARFADALGSVVETPQVVDIGLKADRGIGRPALDARLYLAPLATSGRGAPRLLGCLQASGQIGRTPRRFGIERVAARPATGGPAVEISYRSPVLPATQAAGFAEDAPAFERSKSRDRKRPHLRLVKSE